MPRRSLPRLALPIRPPSNPTAVAVAATVPADAVTDRVTAIAQSAINVGMLSMVKALQMFKREYAVVDRERAYKRCVLLTVLYFGSLITARPRSS